MESRRSHRPPSPRLHLEPILPLDHPSHPSHRRHRLETHPQLDLRPRRLPRRRHMGNRQLLRPHPPDRPLTLARRPQHRTPPRPTLAHQRTLRPRLRRRYRIPRLLRPRPLLLKPRLRPLRRPRPQMGLLNHPWKPLENTDRHRSMAPARTSTPPAKSQFACRLRHR